MLMLSPPRTPSMNQKDCRDREASIWLPVNTECSSPEHQHSTELAQLPVCSYPTAPQLHQLSLNGQYEYTSPYLSASTPLQSRSSPVNDPLESLYMWSTPPTEVVSPSPWIPSSHGLESFQTVSSLQPQSALDYDLQQFDRLCMGNGAAGSSYHSFTSHSIAHPTPYPSTGLQPSLYPATTLISEHTHTPEQWFPPPCVQNLSQNTPTLLSLGLTTIPPNPTPVISINSSSTNPPSTLPLPPTLPSSPATKPGNQNQPSRSPTPAPAPNTDLTPYGIPIDATTWRCAYPGCTSATLFRRGCDLRKHFNRHRKHLFCRFEECPNSREGGFSSQKDRARHEAKHNPGIGCEWPACGRVFSRVDNMKDHVRRIHRRV